MAKKKSRLKEIADFDFKKVSSENLTLSFEFIDWSSNAFFIHGLEKSYYEKLFECFSTIKRSKEIEITQQTHPSLSPKFINFKGDGSTLIKTSFPLSVLNKLKISLKMETGSDEEAEENAKEILGNAFEVSFGKNYGRIHGFIFDNKFHLVWFDPAHNLFPGKDRTTGKKRKIKKHSDVAIVRTYCPEEFARLQDTILKLQEENDELIELLEQQTKPQ
jgi:hypothetical protein